MPRPGHPTVEDAPRGALHRVELLQAHALTCHGWMGTSPGAMAAILAALLQRPVSVENAYDVYWKLPDRWKAAVRYGSDNVRMHRALPPLRGDCIRVHHSLLKGCAVAGAVIDSVLKDGLRPQPEGAGKYSEAPWAVFAVTDTPTTAAGSAGGGGERLRYNEDAPWVTADIPVAWEGWRFMYTRGTDFVGRHGSVVYFGEIPREFIVAINGVPVTDFIRSRGWLTPTLAPSAPRGQRLHVEDFPLRRAPAPKDAPQLTADEARRLNEIGLYHGYCLGGRSKRTSAVHGSELVAQFPHLAVATASMASFGGLYVALGNEGDAWSAAERACKAVAVLGGEPRGERVCKVFVHEGDAFALDEDVVGWAVGAFVAPGRGDAYVVANYLPRAQRTVWTRDAETAWAQAHHRFDRSPRSYRRPIDDLTKRWARPFLHAAFRMYTAGERLGDGEMLDEVPSFRFWR